MPLEDRGEKKGFTTAAYPSDDFYEGIMLPKKQFAQIQIALDFHLRPPGYNDRPFGPFVK